VDIKDAKQLVKSGLDLVTLPDVYLRVKAVLDDRRTGAAELAQAIETDPALCARLLRMANSPFFGFAAEIHSVHRAVSMLGNQQIHDLVLATSLGETFAGIDSTVLNMEAFWCDSVRRAVGAKVLARACCVLDSERVFVAGLLCHIGELVMALRAPHMLEATLPTTLGEGSFGSQQRELFGFDYLEVGAELLLAWKLPESLESIVRFHGNPNCATNFALETAIVHVSALLIGHEAAEINEAVLGLINISSEELARVSDDIDAAAAEVLALMQPSTRMTA
jgi:HD-like signal output (HDOD) protein